MQGGPDFVHELDVRWFAFREWAIFLPIFLVLVAATIFVPELSRAPVWVWGISIIGGLNLIVYGYFFIPMLVRGGRYRAIIENGRLRVDCPFEKLGPSFEIGLDEIEKLVVRENSEGPDNHEIHPPGQILVLDSFRSANWLHPAKDIFVTIQRLRPNIPLIKS